MDITKHSKTILSLREILNKSVILCEGDISAVIDKGYSPAFYRRHEQFQDSLFYKNALPKEIRKSSPPRFFNCGSRGQVLKVYFKLKELHEAAPAESYLNPDKLFAIIDLDIQNEKINNYSFNNTEEIFKDLYNETEINKANIDKHKIFVTGLIHKEGYFLLPQLKNEVLAEYKNPLFFNSEKFDLDKIYLKIIDEIDKDEDLKIHFDFVKHRINFTDLNKENINELKNSFKRIKKFDDKIIFALFLLRKVKPYWKEIKTKDSMPEERLREQLLLKIANFYSEQNDPDFHLTAIFNSIYYRKN